MGLANYCLPKMLFYDVIKALIIIEALKISVQNRHLYSNIWNTFLSFYKAHPINGTLHNIL